MRSLCLITAVLFLLAPFPLTAKGEPDFKDHFLDKTLRIDYFHIGDGSTEIITLDQIYEQGPWAGNPDRLLDTAGLGRYGFKVYDIASNRLVFSKGFDSYFGEYKTTGPAGQGIQRTYHESALVPFPRGPVRFVIEKRDRNNLYHPIFVREIDPDDVDLIRFTPNPQDRVFEVAVNGHPHKKVDLAIIGEGYTAAESGKFEKDLSRYASYLFSLEPYKSMKDRFNIRGVLRPSAESGTDEPRKKIFKNTVINSSFNAFHLERYLLTEDNRSLQDIAAGVPYDALVILVNSERYGGGGIYNFYAIFTSDSGQWERHVFLHEFGHHFAGLADEYYASAVAYNEFYPPGVEPPEPNITALLDPERIKWKHLLSPGAGIPTDWGKETYDGLSKEYDRHRSAKNEAVRELVAAKASEEEIKAAEEAYDTKADGVNEKILKFLRESPVRDTVGAFEGAGYASKGLYRPMLNCLMLKFLEEEIYYCKVCEEAVRKQILYYSE